MNLTEGANSTLEGWIDLKEWIADNDPLGTGEVEMFSIDSNDDGQDELFICFTAPFGSGPNYVWDVLIKKGNMCKEIGRIDGNVEILEEKTNGYRDIAAT